MADSISVTCNQHCCHCGVSRRRCSPAAHHRGAAGAMLGGGLCRCAYWPSSKCAAVPGEQHRAPGNFRSGRRSDRGWARLRGTARSSYGSGAGPHPIGSGVESPSHPTRRRYPVHFCRQNARSAGRGHRVEWWRWRRSRWITGCRGTRRDGPCAGPSRSRSAIHATCSHDRGSSRCLPGG
jgi:hypothetical protein